MNNAVRLLSTDFDGTLVSDSETPLLIGGLASALGSLKSKGVAWAVNTGRTLEQLEHGLRNLVVQPDYALTSEREIFRRAVSGGWEDFGDWNAKCEQAHQNLHETTRPLMQTLTHFVEKQTQAHTVQTGKFPVGIIGSSEEEIEIVASFIDDIRGDYPDFHYQRNSIYLRFCHVDYDKGGALSELGRLLEIPREEIFAIGDNLNDLAMLNGGPAAHVACPSNALGAVKTVVREAGGYVSELPDAEGTLDALRRLFPEFI